MPEFVMPLDNQDQINSFHALDDFTRGYVEAMFWTECTPDNPELENKTFGDLSEEALEAIKSQCANFQKVNAEALAIAYAEHTEKKFPYNEERAGTDFWLSRNGHGAGFFDRAIPNAKELQAACGWRTQFGEVTLYAGDDHKLYF